MRPFRGSIDEHHKIPKWPRQGLYRTANRYTGNHGASKNANNALPVANWRRLELVREEGLLDDAMLDDILRPENMIAPRLVPLKA